MVNQQKQVRKKLPSTVVVNYHNYESHVSMTPFGSKTVNIGTGIHKYDHSLQLHYRQFTVALFC